MKQLRIAKPCRVVGALTLTVFAGMAIADNTNVDGKFQAFGSARLVVGGVPPDNMAADLTSNCGNQPYSSTCYSNTSQFTFSGVAFALNSGHQPTLSGITTLSTDYNFGGADCGGGSPRFVILTNTSVNFEGYFGQPPNFTNCYYGWLNTGNLTTDSTMRWVVNNGNTDMSWSELVSTYGSFTITEIDIVVDGGWITPKGQDLTIDNFTINNKVMKANDAFHH